MVEHGTGQEHDQGRDHRPHPEIGNLLAHREGAERRDDERGEHGRQDVQGRLATNHRAQQPDEGAEQGHEQHFERGGTQDQADPGRQHRVADDAGQPPETGAHVAYLLQAPLPVVGPIAPRSAS